MSEKSVRNSLKVRGVTPPCELIFKEIWKRKSFRGESSVLHGKAGRGLALAALAAFAVMDTAQAESAMEPVVVPAGESLTLGADTVTGNGSSPAVTLQSGGTSLVATGTIIRDSTIGIYAIAGEPYHQVSLDGVDIQASLYGVQLQQTEADIINSVITSNDTDSSMGMVLSPLTTAQVTDSTVNGWHYGVYLNRGSILTLNGKTTINSLAIGVGVKASGSLVINEGVTINATSSDVSKGVYLEPGVKQEGTVPEDSIDLKMVVVNLNGGSIVSTGTGIQGVGNNHGTTVNINGGRIMAAKEGIYQPQYGLLNISAGEIVGVHSAVEARAGEVTITGGILMSTATEFSARPNSNGHTVEGAAVVVSQHGTDLSLAVSISGGTFSGIYALYEEDLQNENAAEKITMSVTGGDFYGKIFSENCASFITGGNFNDASALNYLGNGAVVNVKLANAYSDDITIGNTATVNLDLNEQTLGDVTVKSGSTLNFVSLADILNETYSYSLMTADDAQGQNSLTSLTVEIGATVTVDEAITVDTVTLENGSTTNVNGELVTAESAAITVTDGDNSNIEQGAVINISNLDIAAGENLKLFSENITTEQLKNATLMSDNVMQEVEASESQDGAVTIKVKDASKELPGAELGNLVTEATKNNTDNAFLDDVLTSGDAGQAVRSLNSVANMGEMAAVNRGASTMMGVMTDALSEHLSLAHGTDREYGKGVWADFISHNENVRGMQLAGLTADYDARYNGLVFGSDLWSGQKTTLGVALTYTEGDIDSVGGHMFTRNDAEYYGLAFYGRSDRRFCSFLYDLGYMRGDNDITQYNSGHVVTATPHSDSISAGVKAEKAVKTGAGTILPYIGLRYMSVKTDDYSNNVGMRYDVATQNIWTLPVGVAYSYEKAVSTWKLRAIADLGYVWAMGDTDTDQSVRLGSGVDSFSYDTMDEGSFVGRIRLEAEKGKTTFGAGYEYRKGDAVSADRWSIYVNRAF